MSIGFVRELREQLDRRHQKDKAVNFTWLRMQIVPINLLYKQNSLPRKSLYSLYS